jgi:hypothetical protein
MNKYQLFISLNSVNLKLMDRSDQVNGLLVDNFLASKSIKIKYKNSTITDKAIFVGYSTHANNSLPIFHINISGKHAWFIDTEFIPGIHNTNLQQAYSKLYKSVKRDVALIIEI